MKRETASKRLSLNLSVENNYLNFLGRGSYFFCVLINDNKKHFDNKCE